MNHHEAMGQLTMNASALEAILRVLAHRLLGDPKVGEIITYRAPIDWLIETCKSLVLLKVDGSLRDEFIKALEDARGAKNDRNPMIHATWLQHGEIPRRLEFRRKNSEITMDMKPSTVEEIRAVSDRIEEVTGRVIALLILQYPDFGESAMKSLEAEKHKAADS